MDNLRNKMKIIWKEDTLRTAIIFHPCLGDNQNRYNAMPRKYRIFLILLINYNNRMINSTDFLKHANALKSNQEEVFLFRIKNKFLFDNTRKK